MSKGYVTVLKVQYVSDKTAQSNSIWAVNVLYGLMKWQDLVQS